MRPKADPFLAFSPARCTAPDSPWMFFFVCMLVKHVLCMYVCISACLSDLSICLSVRMDVFILSINVYFMIKVISLFRDRGTTLKVGVGGGGGVLTSY